MNRTNVTLIPKIQGPEVIGNYHPINLCNMVYKPIPKIIVARLRSLLGKIVSPVQSTFVPGRKGVDNTIIVQETIHTISRKRGKVWYMAIKVDLEKAYDKLEWGFIHDTLLKVNLHKDLVKLLMSFISTTSTLVLFNGGNLEPFYPSRGMQQGGPLSPYIFILCMEALGKMVEEKSREKVWKPIKTSRNGIAFSHLLFVDDLMFFAKANATNCSTIRDLLDEFCSKSRQMVSETKSRVFFSPNVDKDTRESLCDLSRNSQDFSFVLDRIKHKLAEWKANLLSFPSRTILVQTSSASIPTYVMQCNDLPAKLSENID